jgi:serine/threonine-protein kinase
VVHTEPVPPRKLNPSVPLKLEGIILKCLAKNPDERYQTGEDLARDLGELRTVGASMGLKTAAPQAVASGADPNATVFESTLAPQTGRATAAQPPERVAAPKSKSTSLLVLTAVVIVLIGAGSWDLLRHKETPAVQVTPPSATTGETPIAKTPATANAEEGAARLAAVSAKPAPSTPASTAPAVVNPSASGPKKPETKVAAAEKTTTANGDSPAPKAEAATPEPAALDFNPKSLDPKTNAKLKIEAGQMPASLDFTVEMNGKLYLRRSAEGNKSEFDDLYVPPGVHEFRVTAGSGPVLKRSNTVSTEFKAKKRHTLKIELRTQGSSPGAGVPQGLYADTQIVLTLK